MRGALAYLAIPAAMVVAILLVWLRARRSRQDAAVLGGFVLVSNVLVQAVKHPGFANPPWSSLDPISGHVGVLGAVALGVVMATAASRQGTVAAVAAALLTATALGVVLAGWHTLPQVLCPLFLVSGAALISSTLLERSREAAPRRGGTASKNGPLVAMVVSGLVTGAGMTLAYSRAPDVQTLLVTALLLIFSLSGAAVMVVLIALKAPTAQPVHASS
jgi:hypothetical protein